MDMRLLQTSPLGNMQPSSSMVVQLGSLPAANTSSSLPPAGRSSRRAVNTPTGSISLAQGSGGTQQQQQPQVILLVLIGATT